MRRLYSVALLITVFVFSASSQPLTWKTFAAGGERFFAIRGDGTLWASGSHNLGEGISVDRRIPIQIGGDTTWASVSADYLVSYALKKDSTLWAWGINYNGYLGDSTKEDRLSPVQIGTDKWVSVVAGDEHAVAIRADGTLWSWGHDYFVGDGSNNYSYTPVQISTQKNAWVKVSGGPSHSLAVKKDGTLWAWGGNGRGEVGNGIPQWVVSSPTQVGTDTDWIDVYGGQGFSLGLKSNGTLWAWGRNDYGQLGDGTTVDKSSPVQVGTDNQWMTIGGGAYHSLAVKKNGTLWAWGNGSALGNGSSVDQTSPIQISGQDNPLVISRGPVSTYSAILRADSSGFCFTGSNWGQFGNNASYTTALLYDCVNSFCLGYSLPATTAAHSIPVGGVGNRVDYQTGCQLSSTITPSGTNPVTNVVKDSVWIEASVPTTNSGQPYVQRHYGITPSQNGSTATATLTLYYTQADFTAYNAVPNHGPDLPIDAADAANNKPNVRIYKRSGTSNNGTGLFDTYSGTTTDIVPTSVVWDNKLNAWAVTFDVVGFSGFFLASASLTPLPLTLVDFSARPQAADGVLNWRTANEQSVAAFEVERSMDARTYAKVGSVPALNRNTGSTYAFRDKNIAALGSPVLYYRLRLVDKDGVFRYSQVVPVNIAQREAVVMLYPNPAREATNLQVASTRKETLRCSIVDATGRTVATRSINVAEGSNVFTIETSRLAAGRYLLQVRGTVTTKQLPFIKQ